MTWIKLNLDRGLGNQLFTFHAGLALASRTKSNLKIDLTGTRDEQRRRQSSIQDLEIEIHNADFEITWLDRDKSSSHIFLERAIHKICKSTQTTRRLMHQFRSLEYGYDPKLYNIHLPSAVWGNYQSWRYPLDLEKSGVIVKMKIRNPTTWYTEMKKIGEDSRPIAIHIRRGDYSDYAHNLGLLCEDYFLEALAHYLNSHDRANRPIWIFSDTVEVAESFMNSLNLPDIAVITPPVESCSAESLLLLSLSSVIITSNSSWSWWAGWLGRQDNHVIIPEPYYKSFEGEFLDHIPPAWEKFPSKWL